MNPDDIRKLIQAAIPDAEVGTQDLTGNGDHYQVLVVSDQFSGKTLLQQHQLVFAALKDALAGQLHAVQLKTFTPEQWENQA